MDGVGVSGARSGRTGESSTAGRKVRTVPPSARFEPPSPPRSPGPALAPASNEAGPSTDPPAKRSRIIRRRYSTSEDSSSGASEYDTTEDENPWWTFTSRGMAKMKVRANTMYHKDDPGRESGVDAVFAPEDSRPEKEKKRKPKPDIHRRKRKSTESSGRSRVPASIRRRSGVESDGVPSPSPGSLLAPAKISPSAPATPREAHPHTYFLRRSHWRDSPRPTTPENGPSAPALNRSNSAPTSPSRAHAHFFDSPEVTLSRAMDSDEPRSSQDPILSSRRARTIPPVRMQSTAPYLPRFRRKRGDLGDLPSDAESPSDMEGPRPRAERQPSNRPKERPVKLGQNLRTGSSRKVRLSTSKSRLRRHRDDEDRGVQTDTPARPRSSRKSNTKLKIQLPDPITDHFKNGWPQAGSWQDAYYGLNAQGRMHDSPGAASHDSSRGAGESLPTSRAKLKSSLNPLRSKPPSGINTPASEFPASSPAEPNTPVVPPPMSRSKSHRKSKRKRHRIALMAPTPSGLGFTPSGVGDERSGTAWKEGRVNAGEFDWSGTTYQDSPSAENGAAGPDNTLRNKEAGSNADSLSRQDTPATGKSEGSSNHWGFFASRLKTRKERRQMRIVEDDWKKRWRRMLFLDARVTIWIRLVNLAVVVAALALSVTIRTRLEDLGVPGIMGSSTTLIISYASLTFVHVMTAIYREYFGRPIGLWGLRSKMLWVCLDLIFIALWSSAITDSANDYIATPLMCTSGSAWWSYEINASFAVQNGVVLDPLANLSVLLGPNAQPKVMDVVLPDTFTQSGPVEEVCDRQVGCIVLSLLAVLLYGGNMVLSLFRIFETVRRTSNAGKAIMV